MSFDTNEMMIDLFRSEVQSHSETLTHSILELEKDPQAASALERMMRSAHSIKGAARIVGIKPAVDVSHVMEDCFVAAQRGQLTLRPIDIDVLLNGVDLLCKVSDATTQANTNWSDINSEVSDLVLRLKCVLEAKPIPEPETCLIKPASPTLVESIVPNEPKISKPNPVVEPHTEAPQPPRTTEIKVGSRLTQQTADEYRLATLDAIAAGRAIQLNLSAVEHFDTVGISFLKSISDYADTAEYSLTFIDARSNIISMLNVIGLQPKAAS
jgi:chemotaxis protein histidine kinase CheA